MAGTQGNFEMEVLIRPERQQPDKKEIHRDSLHSFFDLNAPSEPVAPVELSSSGGPSEQGGPVELSEAMEPGGLNEASEPVEISEQDRLKRILKEGNIDDIRDKLTPKALTKCEDNAFLVAMKTSNELRRLAAEKGPSEEDFSKLADSVEQFTSCLLDPLKSNTEARHAFGDSLDDVMDAAINCEQKRVLAHPVLYSLMTEKWLGKFGKMKVSSWFSFERWLWIFLNIWCLFDLVMFPLLKALFSFYVNHLACKQKLKKRGMDVAFLINTTSQIADDAFNLIRRTIEKFITTHGDKQDEYQIFIHGDKSTPRKICAENVKTLRKGTEEFPALHKNLREAHFFKISQASKKIIIFFTDHKTSLKRESDLVKSQVQQLKGITLLSVGVGPHISIRELKKITKERGYGVIHVGECEKPDNVRKMIWHELQGKDIYESYLEYFRTPYFIFVRDTLSYLALLGLHFAICLTPSNIPFSGVEWAILLFFLGRMLMGIGQVLSIQRQTKVKNTNPTWKSTCGKYLSGLWNVLDLLTLTIYVTTFALRIITWALSTSVANNRALAVAGYLYGLNTMFLTVRTFGHVMETIKGVGAIQIALFQIIGAIATIFWQFIAAILAFSIAITKVYMAERSYISKQNHTHDLVCKTPGISCWWTMVKHLCWSLLGIAELDPLDSVDNPSVTVAHLLFGAFLVIGVILLVNMMIAILSNTYQRVEDNSLMEWSYKKAITMQTYSTCHPVTVPLNLIWWIYPLCRKCISRFCRGCNWHFCLSCFATCRRRDGNDNDDDNAKARIKTLDAVVKNLQIAYFATYGCSFPVTDDSQMILQETRRNQQMTNQIAYRTFITNAFDQGTLPAGQEAWDTAGIVVDGCLLTCLGEEACKICKEKGPAAYHGARYRVPFSQEFPHFEVLITDDKRFMGVGVVWQNYGKHVMPGKNNGTVGYLVDEGKIFGSQKPVDPTAGKEYDDAIGYRGDVIGCTVQPDAGGKVQIVFSLNGKQITEDKIVMEYSPEYSPTSIEMYPYICMGQTGMTVLAKMSSSKSDDPQSVAKSITAISDATNNISHTFNSNFKTFDTRFYSLETDLRKSQEKVKDLMRNVTKGLENLEDFIQGRFQQGKEKLERMEGLEEALLRDTTSFKSRYGIAEDTIEEEHAQHTSCVDGTGLGDLKPTTDLLTKTHEKLANLENNAYKRFSSFFERLKNLEENIKEGTEIQKTKEEMIQQKLHQLQESIVSETSKKRNLTTYRDRKF